MGHLYPGFGQVAEEEGFPEIARTFRHVANVESYHERRYRKILDSLLKGLIFKRADKKNWKCRNCGYIYEGFEAL
jgi:rubrerythrin